MDSILYYTKASISSDAELQEINVLRKTGNTVSVRNGALRPENVKSFEINFDKVVESGSTVKVDEKSKDTVPIKPFFTKEKT